MLIETAENPADFVMNASLAFMETTDAWADLTWQNSHELSIDTFSSGTPGHGATVMRHLTGLCDQHDVSLSLRVMVEDENPSHDAEKLVRYYEQFGFRETGRGQNERDGSDEIYMEREPQNQL